MYRSAMIALAASIVALALSTPAKADPLAAGGAAFRRGDFLAAARLLIPLAERGSARAQAMVGFMHATGQGLPQSFPAAAHWYRLSAEQGDTTAQYLLGLMYDKGQGVPQDEVAAYMWLNLAATAAPKRNRESFMRLRDAVATKMSRGQLAEGQWRASQWAPQPPAR